MQLAHCQICERAIKASKGLIAHHGYRRPGQGWQTASCFGARWRPYEAACDALPHAIKACEAFVENRKAFIAERLANPPATLDHIETRWGRPAITTTLPRPEGFDVSKRPGSWSQRTYEAMFWGAICDAEHAIKMADQDGDRMRKRLAAWKAPAEETAA